jgi:hypothetical protein
MGAGKLQPREALRLEAGDAVLLFILRFLSPGARRHLVGFATKARVALGLSWWCMLESSQRRPEGQRGYSPLRPHYRCNAPKISLAEDVGIEPTRRFTSHPLGFRDRGLTGRPTFRCPGGVWRDRTPAALAHWLRVSNPTHCHSGNNPHPNLSSASQPWCAFPVCWCATQRISQLGSGARSALHQRTAGDGSLCPRPPEFMATTPP